MRVLNTMDTEDTKAKPGTSLTFVSLVSFVFNPRA